MLRSVGAAFLCGLILSGCAAAFPSWRGCAESPEGALSGLFEALNSSDAISTDIAKPPMNLREILDFKKIMRVAPDPPRLLNSMGRGNPRKGWEEFRFLKSLNVFHNISGLEFLEYRMSVAGIRPLLPLEPDTARYEVILKRTDLLLDMSDDRDFKEVEKIYFRTFISTFTDERWCLVGLEPASEWQEFGSYLRP